MQVKAENFTLLSNIIGRAKEAVIFLPKDPNLDVASAGLFLEQNLSSLGKKVMLVFSGKLPKELESYSDKISEKLPAKKLVVSFNWKKNAVEKVSYNLDGDSFNFIINPLNKKIEVDDVTLFHQGLEPDLIVTVGIESPSDIADLEPEFFENKTVINISKSNKSQEFGSLNFINPSADSFSALVANVFDKAQVSIVPETANLLLEGIRSATENFQKVSDATSFEGAAFCTRIKEGTSSAPNPQKGPEVSPEWLSPKVFKSKESPN